MLFLFGLASRRRAEVAASEEQPDEELMRAALADPLAFTRLYDRYLEPIYSYCYVRLNSREAAEDASSEVFLKAFTALGSYRGGMFAAWLFRIAHNVVINLQTRQRPHASFEMSELADPSPSMEETIIIASELEDLRVALAQLPDEQRTVLELQCAGWSGAQISEALDKSAPAIRMLRHRAVERLKQLILGSEMA